MPEVNCTKCGATAVGLERPPLPGEVGKSVVENSCAACWKEWLGRQVILINEQSLSPAKPEHYQLLVGEMRGFLQLP